MCGASIERNLPPRHPLEQHDHVAGRLKDLIRRRRIHRPRDAGDETMRGRIVVSAVRKLPVDPLGPRPRLIRKFPVRRIDDDALVPGRQEIPVVPFEAVVGAAGIRRSSNPSGPASRPASGESVRLWSVSPRWPPRPPRPPP